MENILTEQESDSGVVIKLSIAADAKLADSISDHLVGAYAAAVEFVVDQKGADTVVHGFLEMTDYSDDKRCLLEQQIAAYGCEMAEIFHLPQPRVSSEVIVQQDWSQKWKEHFKPFEIIPGLIIAPSWEPGEQPAGSQVIVMDPGMAFGTGHHATTRLCLAMLMCEVQRTNGCSVLDVGTGTGILAMAAALFGADSILGVDNDQDAVTAARDNAGKNNLETRLTVSGRDLAEIEGSYHLVVANIVHDVLLELADDLSRLTKPGGILVLSGLIYGQQTENMSRCFLEKGFTLVEEAQDGEWGALKLRKLRE